MTSSRPSTASPAARRTATFLLRQPRQVQGFREPLAGGADLTDDPAPTDGLALTMIWIPPGRFWMGSPKTELQQTDAEGPQRLVQLPGFFMGQTPITQAQWRAVAQWQPPEGRGWERDLDPEPSRFQPESAAKKALDFHMGTFALLEGEESTDQRPVEGVSWGDAMEFCQRLNSRLGAGAGHTYTLPSESLALGCFLTLAVGCWLLVWVVLLAVGLRLPTADSRRLDWVVPGWWLFPHGAAGASPMGRAPQLPGTRRCQFCWSNQACRSSAPWKSSRARVSSSRRGRLRAPMRARVALVRVPQRCSSSRWVRAKTSRRASSRASFRPSSRPSSKMS